MAFPATTFHNLAFRTTARRSIARRRVLIYWPNTFLYSLLLTQSSASATHIAVGVVITRRTRPDVAPHAPINALKVGPSAPRARGLMASTGRANAITASTMRSGAGPKAGGELTDPVNKAAQVSPPT